MCPASLRGHGESVISVTRRDAELSGFIRCSPGGESFLQMCVFNHSQADHGEVRSKQSNKNSKCGRIVPPPTIQQRVNSRVPTCVVLAAVVLRKAPSCCTLALRFPRLWSVYWRRQPL